MHLMLAEKESGTYATAAESKRIDGKVVKTNKIYLGRVVDLDKGIFESRERGLFTFDLETGEFGQADMAGLPKRCRGRKVLVTDFGDMFVLDRFLREIGLYDCIDASCSPNPDTFKALVCYYVLTTDPNSWAMDWYSTSYASVLFPNADMDDCRISEFLKRIGSTEVMRLFFQSYIPMVTANDPVTVIVDSTGAPNSVHMDITGVNNHNGEISREVRIIFVCRKSDRLPLFARYVPGNVVDSDTLARTFDELERLGIDAEYAILDAGYCTLENMESLLESHIGFITRLKPNYKMYKDMVEDFADKLDAGTRVLYNDRFIRVYSAERRMTDSGKKVWLHLMVDEDMKNAEEKTAFRKFQVGEIDQEQLDRAYATAGMFILVSSFWIDREEVIPTYFERGGIEQVFDTGKTEGRLGKAAVHSEESFAGKLLLDFISIAVKQMLQNHLKKRKEELSSRKRKNKDAIPGRNLSAHHAMYILRGQKCDVFENRILPREKTKAINDTYKLFGYECPRAIDRVPEHP